MPRSIVDAAFGAENRTRLIDRYFSEHGEPHPEVAWQHVYRMLLWIDRTTGLAHCYESDKSQPGKNWYARSLAFHAWLASALEATPAALADQLDWLFRRATADLAAAVLHRQDETKAKAEEQRRPYANMGMPSPGEDPELVAIIEEVLGEWLSQRPPSEVWVVLTQRMREYLTLENKRKNLVGEGFEDVLAATIQRLPDASSLDVRARRPLQEIPGFGRVRRGDKPNKVDVAVVDHERQDRTLITAKWSVRADRERQFRTDFQDYGAAESDNRPFNYVLVTNEFDPARLVRACDYLYHNAPMFTRVVHISTQALRAAYGIAPQRSAAKVLQRIDEGRLIGLGEWLSNVAVRR